MRHLHRIAAVCSIAFLPVALHAQASLGIKGGLSFGTLDNKLPDWKNRTGFAAGVAFDLRAGAIGLQPEALYVQKGVDFNGTPSSSSQVPRLSYIEIPVLVKLTLPMSGIQPMAYAGPSVSFRVSCSFQGYDCSSYTSKTDYGVVLGGGLRFGGDHGVTLEGRYEWGLKDVNDPGAGVKQRTRTFLALVGFSL